MMKFIRVLPFGVFAVAALPVQVAHADMVSKQKAIAACSGKVEVGPLTPYGESAAEQAAKRIAYEWNCMSMVQGKPIEAFEKYVSKDFCDHSHLLTRGRKDCGNYEETLANFTRMVQQFGGGDSLEVPVMASVNGEMVTMFGAGVDIFRVKDGKLTDHWDASPPARATINAHAPGFAEWVWGERKGPPPMLKNVTPKSVLVDEAVLTSVNMGPMTPYAETTKEQANKWVVFAWNYMSNIQGKSKEAAERYVAADYCDHSHMMTRGKKLCATREEMLASPIGQTKAAKLGDKVVMPHMATVNGEIVTMYGEGIDIFRVQNGKITDHWDASPPTQVTIAEHSFDTVERMMKTLAGDDSGFGPPGGGMGAGGPPAK
ncbi:MAG: hypothetical protein QM808_16660 [Steroidobacteraceae bacterium]